MLPHHLELGPFISSTCLLYLMNLLCASSLEVEESDEGFSGVFPVGRGLSTMTRPTT